MTWRGSTTIQDRIFGCLPYLLPLVIAMQFGGALFQQFPILALPFLPLVPIQALYSAIPFGELIIFLVLIFAVVRNPRIPHFIRFNTMQAILIDICLILCQIVLSYIIQPVGSAFLMETLSNTIFLGAIAAIGFSLVQCVRGLYPEIPVVSDAVYMQVR